MQYITPVILIVCLFILIFMFHKKRCHKIEKKLKEMSSSEKNRLFNDLAAPIGLSLDSVQDILTTRTDAWQKEFGYGELYDQAALAMQMVFDCEPVYFNHGGKTWLIELWKGQYGFSTGAEAGIYHASSVVPPALRGQTIFRAAEENEMLPVRLSLTGTKGHIFTLEETHWWLGGFVPGVCALPEDLTLEVTLTFPIESLSRAFTRALKALGYKEEDILVSDTTVEFAFTRPKAVPSISWDTWLQSYVLWKGRLSCRMYLWITRPFSAAADRLLYLYLLLPFVCRKTLSIRSMKKRYRRRP